MRSRIPTDDETLTAARAQGLLGPDEIPDTRQMARLKRWLVEAGEMAAVERRAEQTAIDISAVVAPPLRALYRDLTTSDSPMSDESAGRVIAALAPQIWRTTITEQPKAAQ